MHVLQVGMSVLAELAEKVAEEANNLSEDGKDWPRLPNQPKRRGPSKGGDVDSGPIKGSVYARPSKNVPTSYLVVSPAWYSHFVEYGTDPHLVVPKGSKRGHIMHFAGTNDSAGKHISKREVKHPGITTPKPFLRPAGDKADAFVDEILRKKGAI